MAEDRDTLIEEEIVAYRDAAVKMRSVLYKALMGGTRSSLEQGCQKALSLVDFVHLAGSATPLPGDLKSGD